MLDVGCGYGWFALNALTRGAREVIGIEVNVEDLKTAGEHIKNSKLELKYGSAIEIPYADEIFDTVVSWDVIEHIPSNTENKMFSEVNRVLKTGGVFYLSTPYDNFFAKIFDPAWWLIGHRHYGLESLEKFANDHGFELVVYEIGGRWWEIINVNNLLISKWIFRRQSFFKNYVDKKRDLEYKSINPDLGLSNHYGFTNIFLKFKKK